VFVRPIEVRDEALRLVGLGLNDCEISRRLEIPRTTVRDWRKPRYVPKCPATSTCPRCGARARQIMLLPEPYAELLGLYLGDGHIAELARAQRLRVSLDSKYPDVVDAAGSVMRACFPLQHVGRKT
jgi:hypothetical protein